MILTDEICELIKHETNPEILEKIITEDKERINYTNMEDYLSHNELTIRKILWNEIDLQELDNKSSLLIISIFLFQNNSISNHDFSTLWRIYYTIGFVDQADLVKLVFIRSNLTKVKSIEDWLHIVINESQNFGPTIPSLREAIDIYDNLIKEASPAEIWNRIEAKIESLNRRPEYIDEIINNTNNDELERILPWVDWEIREKITTHLIDEFVGGLSSPINPEIVEENFDKNSFTEYFPTSLHVLRDRIAEFSPHALDTEKLNQIPAKLIKEWAPKFVYSQPGRKQNIRIFFPGGKGIGHSAIVIKTNDGMMLLDFGLSVVNNSIPKWLPLLEKIDVVLLSHAHLDHSGSIPLLMRNSNKLAWFGHKDTRIMTEMLWHDTRNILNRNYSNEILQNDPIIRNLVSERNILNALTNFNEIKLGETYTLLPEVEVTAHNAAHLFGSVGYELNISGKRILYTGDFNSDRSLTFKGAEFPIDADITIFDGTYYGRYSKTNSVQPKLEELLKTSKRIIIPAFSMGRSQEMLFRLKKLGAEKNWKIYLIGMGGKLAQKLNLTVGSSGGGRSTGISILNTISPEEFTEKSIIISGQGMLQAGTSRRLLDYTADDPNTSVILCGYQAPYTLGNQLLNEHKYLKNKYLQNITRISVSGHTSGKTLDTYIDKLSGRKIIVHSPEGTSKNLTRNDILLPPNFNPVNI